MSYALVALRASRLWSGTTRLVLVGSCLLASVPARSNEPAGLVRTVREKMDAATPAKVVAELVASGAWTTLIAMISSGNTAAISLVPKLADGTDAGTSEDLTIGLADALPTNATREVLEILTPDRRSILSFDRVCSAPFIEDTARHQRSYKAAALAAVRRVYRTDSDLTLSGEFCIAELKKVRG